MGIGHLRGAVHAQQALPRRVRAHQQRGYPQTQLWAFKLLSELYPERFDLPKVQGDVEYAAFTDGRNVQVLVYAQDMDYFRHEKQDVAISVNMQAAMVSVWRIDDTHCNPKSEWQKLGSPDLLTREEIAAIKQNTRLCEENMPFTAENGITNIQFSLSANDVALLTSFAEE